jgi:hypothetical protein
MTQEHPITPPTELFKKWVGMPRSLAFVAAYRAGADQELEACCEYISNEGKWFANPEHRLAELRDARRPKSPSLKQQALEILDDVDAQLGAVHYNILRRALEQLDG